MVAAWYYTGGRSPYGYRGLGEVSVFVFFGLVATVGTTYVQAEEVTAASVLAGVGCGALACAILVANNLRDIPTDELAGKRTLAVRLGDRRTRLLYVALVFTAYAVVVLIAVQHLLVMVDAGHARCPRCGRRSVCCSAPRAATWCRCSRRPACCCSCTAWRWASPSRCPECALAGAAQTLLPFPPHSIPRACCGRTAGPDVPMGLRVRAGLAVAATPPGPDQRDDGHRDHHDEHQRELHGRLLCRCFVQDPQREG